MTHRPILIVADARTERGKGHIMRCQAIADLLRQRGKSLELIHDTDSTQTVTYLREKLNSNSLLILDGRDYDLAFEKCVKCTSCTLLRLIDLPLQNSMSDAVISYSLWGAEAEKALSSIPNRFLGVEYAVVNDAYNRCKSQDIVSKKAFICCGGLDAEQICQRIVNFISDTGLIDSCTIVTPRVNHAAILKNEAKITPRLELLCDLTVPELASALQSASVAITSASTIALEACTAGVPAIVGITVHDQQFLYEQLIHRGVAFGAGTFSSKRDLEHELHHLLSTSWNEVRKKQREIFDGRGSERFLMAIEKVLG